MSSWERVCSLVASTAVLGAIPALAAPRAPQCADPLPQDPVRQYESLPTHAQITEYLASTPGRTRFTCSSAQLTYAGTREPDGIRVIARYRAGGGVQAETYAKDENETGDWRRHGNVRIQRRDGGTQSLQYFCNGFEVGLHRYFDTNGELDAVVDFSRSDYEWRKPLDGRPYRDFYVALGHLGSPTGLERVQRFREVYRVRGEHAERVAFAAATVFGSDWQALDPASTVRQWTEPGLQGPVIRSGEPTRIRNYDFDYLSFAEVYQRKRLGSPGPRPPQAFHSLLLECPWIDEAMQLGLTDARFSFEPPAQYTESERSVSPQQQFVTCLREPNVTCLLEQALASARYSRPLYGKEMRAFADVALAAAKPELARDAMAEVLADTQGFTLPSPTFARQAAVKAEAEAALGRNDEAQKSADAALAHALGPNTHAAGKDVDTLEEVGPRLAHVGAIGKAREAFDAIPLQYAADNLFTLEAIGVAQARQGDIAGARTSIDELAATARAAPHGASDDPLALVELAAGQAERGDLDTSAATLARIPEQALASAAPGNRLDVAAQYCESGKVAQGLSILDSARAAQRQPTAESLADLGATEARCGRVERARVDFRLARKVISRMPHYRGDEIGAEPDRLASLHLRQRILDAGLLDSLPAIPADDHRFAVAVALKRLEAGDVASAWSTLGSIPAADATTQGWDLAVELALARAQGLAKMARIDAAEREFALARQLALTINDQPLGAELLVRLAQARLRNDQPEQARAALAEAQAALLDALALANPRGGAAFSVTSLARTWAAADNDSAANDLITASVAQLRMRAIAARASDWINGEIAASLARAGKAPESIAGLRKIERSSPRVWFLAQLTAIARDGNDHALSLATAQMWRTELLDVERTVDDANGADERRRLYHAYLAALRAQSAPVTESQRDAALDSLRRRLMLFGTDGARARAGCELAFTLQRLEKPAAATALFAEAQEIKIRRSATDRNMLIDKPAPAGACAYWMAKAGMTAQAQTAVGKVFAARREWLAARGNGPQAAAQRVLQELAMVLAEYEAGEIDWQTGARLTAR